MECASPSLWQVRVLPEALLREMNGLQKRNFPGDGGECRRTRALRSEPGTSEYGLGTAGLGEFGS